MAGIAAVGVDDDLAAGETGIAHGAADHEAAGGVDVHDRVRRAQLGLDAGQDDRLDDIGAQALDADIGIMLRRDHHGSDTDGHAVLVLDGDLGLAIGSQVVELVALAHLGEPARHAMRQRDGQGHQLGRLTAGEAEHHALVAGAELFAVDAHGDVT